MKPFDDHITGAHESKVFFRRLVVRAIEDVILVGLVCLSIAFVCAVCSLGLRWLGVA